MCHPFDSLSIPNRPGRLIFTPCPGTKGSSLENALGILKQAGADVVLTLMPYAELAQNAVIDLPVLCDAQGLRWLHLPVADDQVPQADFDAVWPTAMAQMSDWLAAGKTIAIHCKGGSGRTGLIAVRILIELGIGRNEAIKLVQALRPKAIQHPAHVGWIAQFGQRDEDA
tara:strand:- start:10145 stop:10654 length:510 start_codon:yes stop_codon:yes gene_type:complete